MKALVPLFLFLVSSLTAAPLTHEELTWVNQQAYYLAKCEGKLGPFEETLFKVYLAQAQAAFAKKANYEGSFIPVTQGIVALFYPDSTASLFDERESDKASEELSAPIIATLTQRLTQEGESLKYKADSLKPKKAAEGELYSSALPWYLSSAKEFRSPPPQTDWGYLSEQLKLVKGLTTSLEPKKIAAIDFWTHQATWEKLAEQYMHKKKVPLQKRIEVRAKLLSTLLDTQIAVFDAKYAYKAPRPTDIDPSFIAVTEAPSYPSYPSDFSAYGRAAAVVLTHYFPEERTRWDNLAEESGLTRIWSGLQLPQDHLAGKALGEQVGQKAIRQE